MLRVVCPHSHRERVLGPWRAHRDPGSVLQPGRAGPAGWCEWWLVGSVTRDAMPAFRRKRWYVKCAPRQHSVRRGQAQEMAFCALQGVFLESSLLGQISNPILKSTKGS